MKHTLHLCALTVMLWRCQLLGQAQKPTFLPTELAERKVRDIQGKLVVYLDRETFQTDKARHEQQFGQLKIIVSSFVVAQLNAAPEIESWQLRGQLIRVLGTKYDGHTPDHFHEPPYVFQAPRSDKKAPTVWAVAYAGDAFLGMDGSRVVVESYVVENGKARLAGRGGSEMDGYELKADQIWNPSANSTSILVHGLLMWASGHELPAAAMLYEVGPTGVKRVWKFAAPGLRLLGKEDGLFVIEYHDEGRHSENLPATTIDVYSVVLGHELPHRVVHQFLP